MEDFTERLSKYLSRCGVASRRKSDSLIRQGRVKVNGITVLEPYFQVNLDNPNVTLDNVKVTCEVRHYYLALNKPSGYLSDLSDPRERRTARELIPVPGRLFPVGRLDYDSEGLILFTNDGAFAQALIHPRHSVEREYLVKLKGRLQMADITALLSGVSLDGQLLRASKVSADKITRDNGWYRIILTEGRNRQVRRMADAVGHPVLRLKRVRIGAIKLGHLRRGEYRHLTSRELRPYVSYLQKTLSREERGKGFNKDISE